MKKMAWLLIFGLLFAGCSSIPPWLPERCQEKEFEIVNGVPHGEHWTCWSDGHWRTMSIAKDGKAHGLQMAWNLDGSIKSKSYYNMGVECSKNIGARLPCPPFEHDF